MQGVTLLSTPRADFKTEMGGWRLGMLMGMVWLWVPHWEVIRHTKPLSRQPAGKQLACRKRSARVGLQPNLGLVQHGRRSSLVFHFICTRTFMSGPQTGVCVCFFCGSHLNHLCCDLFAGGTSGERAGLVIKFRPGLLVTSWLEVLLVNSFWEHLQYIHNRILIILALVLCSNYSVHFQDKHSIFKKLFLFLV